MGEGYRLLFCGLIRIESQNPSNHWARSLLLKTKQWLKVEAIDLNKSISYSAYMLLLQVPLPVSISIGHTWGHMETFPA